MANVSLVSPANLIATSRTAAAAAASSTATPVFPSTITTWTLPGQAAQPLVKSTQSFSTKQGEVFTDFASGNIQGGSQRSLQSGTPGIFE
jgi:NAD/NADP transhydrogenase alpha subunit